MVGSHTGLQVGPRTGMVTMEPAAGRDEAVLVLRVWHDPGFRARVMVRDPDTSKPAGRVFADPHELVAYLTHWVHEET